MINKADSPKNICVVVSSLGKGGAERSSALLTKMLNMLDHQVFLVSMQGTVDYEYDGQFLNLGALKSKKDNLWHRFKRVQLLRQYLKQKNIDLVIDNRPRNLFYRDVLFNKHVYRNQKTVYVVRSNFLPTYFPKQKWKAQFLYKKSEALVGVSKGIVQSVEATYGLDNIHLIYNPVEERVIASAAIENNKPFIMTLGRLDDGVKNFSLLLEAYALSNLPKHNISLLILGSGKDELSISKKIIALGIEEYVMMKPFDPNPETLLTNAFFVTLTSRYEGFPRAIIEALANGTPVVSVDCETGPSEIIKDRENGLLVPNYDKNAFASAMNIMIEDGELYQKCKQHAKSSVAHLSLENIAVHWQKLIDEIC